MREQGFYWVIPKNTTKWTISEWIPDWGWCMPGYEGGASQDWQFIKINENRIKTPDES